MSSNPQTFNIVKCFNCSMYQVDINKKSTNKWLCKLCGSKQTLKQVFYESDSAKDCRERVKQLNSLNGERQMQQQNANLARHLNQTDYNEQENNYYSNQTTTDNNKVVSKWAKYLTKKEFNKYYGDDDDNQDEQNDQQSVQKQQQYFNFNQANNTRNFY
jgi:hypothetical protein